MNKTDSIPHHFVKHLVIAPSDIIHVEWRFISGGLSPVSLTYTHKGKCKLA